MVTGEWGFESSLDWYTLMTSTFRNHDNDVLGDGFVRAVKFSLLGGADLQVLYGCLVHGVLWDGDGAILKVIGFGEYPCVTRGRLLDASIRGEHMLDLFCIVKDAGGHASD